MNIKIFKTAAVCAVFLCVLAAGKFTYSLSGSSIPADARTVSIPYFPNNATLVSPTLSSTLTDELQTRFMNQTKLQLVPENGDLAFQGEITNYTVMPVAVTSDDMAAMNRLTITVKVKFTNNIDPTFNYDQSFFFFLEYSSSLDLSTAESSLIPELVTQLVDDIFNAAVSNW